MENRVIVHIGLPKTGSTSLQIALSNRVEFNYVYRSRYFYSRNWFKYNSYFDFLSKNGYDTTKPIFDTDESILTQGNANFQLYTVLHRMKKELENFRVILFIREQRSWLLSRYKHSILHGQDGKFLSLTFEEWLIDSLKGREYIGLMRYDEIIRIIERIIGKDRLKVYLFEEYVRNPKIVINDIFSFFGFDNIQHNIELDRKNSSFSDDFYNRYIKINKFRLGRQGTVFAEMEKKMYAKLIKFIPMKKGQTKLKWETSISQELAEKLENEMNEANIGLINIGVLSKSLAYKYNYKI